MKKILVLLMTYENSLIMDEYFLLLKHYREIIRKYKLNNIEIWGYTGDHHIKDIVVNTKKHLITIPISDYENNAMTFEKTKKVFSYCLKNFNFDYIYRGNTSTYTNIVLLNTFIQKHKDLLDDNVICGSEIYGIGQIENNKITHINCLYIRGNSIILNKKVLNTIVKSPINSVHEVGRKADDDTIGVILSLENPKIHLVSYFQEWAKCVNNPECTFGNDNISIENLKHFIAIQVKQYEERGEKEIKVLKQICDEFENEYAYDDTDIEFIEKVIKAPALIWLNEPINRYCTINEYSQITILPNVKKIIKNVKGI